MATRRRIAGDLTTISARRGSNCLPEYLVTSSSTRSNDKALRCRPNRRYDYIFCRDLEQAIPLGKSARSLLCLPCNQGTIELLTLSVQPGRLPIPGGNFSVVFGSLQSNYSFSRFLTLSTILQLNTANTQAGSANVRLRWNYRPDSDLYVIYTAGQRFASLTAANPAQFFENRFAVKWTYSWQR